MYKVMRDGGKVKITDWKGSTIYSVDEDALVVYEADGKLKTDKLKMLNDEELLLALAKSVKLPI